MSAVYSLEESQTLFINLQADVKGFEALATELKKLTGINLPTNTKNMSLMAGRLRSVIQEKDYSGYGALIKAIRSGDAKMISTFISSLTTNTTQFFREKNHFTILPKFLRDIMDAKRRTLDRELRVWCAAASVGSEPYTMLMTILETIEYPGPFRLKFLASDIDMVALKRASQGLYSESEVEGVDTFLKIKYFERSEVDGNDFYQVKKEYRELIQFAPFNLMEAKYPFNHRFDIIFCRNVLIYFDREGCLEVIAKLVDQIKLGGYLFLGHAEAGNMRNDRVKVVSNSAYQKIKE